MLDTDALGVICNIHKNQIRQLSGGLHAGKAKSSTKRAHALWYTWQPDNPTLHYMN